MGQVLIQNIDDEIIESFKLKAELHGRSLEQELGELLRGAAPLTVDEKLALSRRLRAQSPELGNVDVEAAIRRGRDDEDWP